MGDLAYLWHTFHRWHLIKGEAVHVLDSCRGELPVGHLYSSAEVYCGAPPCCHDWWHRCRITSCCCLVAKLGWRWYQKLEVYSSEFDANLLWISNSPQISHFDCTSFWNGYSRLRLYVPREVGHMVNSWVSEAVSWDLHGHSGPTSHGFDSFEGPGLVLQRFTHFVSVIVVCLFVCCTSSSRW